jgi:hypothetical protein
MKSYTPTYKFQACRYNPAYRISLQSEVIAAIKNMPKNTQQRLVK